MIQNDIKQMIIMTLRLSINIIKIKISTLIYEKIISKNIGFLQRLKCSNIKFIPHKLKINQTTEFKFLLFQLSGRFVRLIIKPTISLYIFLEHSLKFSYLNNFNNANGIPYTKSNFYSFQNYYIKSEYFIMTLYLEMQY